MMKIKEASGITPEASFSSTSRNRLVKGAGSS
jgi:hypothetical protein